MITHRQADDPIDPWPTSRRQGGGAGSILLAAGLGVGLGLLVAPERGQKTRRQLKKRLGVLSGVALETLSDRLGPGIEDLGKASRKAGKQARKRARKRFADLQKAASEQRDSLGGRFRDARKRLSEREEEWEDEAEDLIESSVDEGEELLDEYTGDDEGGSGFLGLAVAIAVGAGVTYLLTNEDAGPARERIREMADDVKRRAEDGWERYQQQRAERSGDRPETGAASLSSDEAPQAS